MGKDKTVTIWFEKDIVMVDGLVYNKKLMTFITGRLKLEYENGILKEEANYLEEKLEGIKRKWFDTEQLKTECFYKK